MTDFYRGAAITFTGECTDAAGAPTTPASARVYLTYTDLTGVRQRLNYAMTVAGSTVTYVWDSAVAEDGVVRWSIRTTGANVMSQDGEFTLLANDSNPTS